MSVGQRWCVDSAWSNDYCPIGNVISVILANPAMRALGARENVRTRKAYGKCVSFDENPTSIPTMMLT